MQSGSVSEIILVLQELRHKTGALSPGREGCAKQAAHQLLCGRSTWSGVLTDTASIPAFVLLK